MVESVIMTKDRHGAIGLWGIIENPCAVFQHHKLKAARAILADIISGPLTLPISFNACTPLEKENLYSSR